MCGGHPLLCWRGRGRCACAAALSVRGGASIRWSRWPWCLAVTACLRCVCSDMCHAFPIRLRVRARESLSSGRLFRRPGRCVIAVERFSDVRLQIARREWVVRETSSGGSFVAWRALSCAHRSSFRCRGRGCLIIMGRGTLAWCHRAASFLKHHRQVRTASSSVCVPDVRSFARLARGCRVFPCVVCRGCPRAF